MSRARRISHAQHNLTESFNLCFVGSSLIVTTRYNTGSIQVMRPQPIIDENWSLVDADMLQFAVPRQILRKEIQNFLHRVIDENFPIRTDSIYHHKYKLIKMKFST